MKNCLKKVADWIEKHPDGAGNIVSCVMMGAMTAGIYFAYKEYLNKSLELEDKRLREAYDLDD